MRIVLSFLLICLSLRVGFSQNLVKNPSFEQYSNCPNSFNQLSYVIDWSNPSAATPDYFNACAPIGSYASVPSHFGCYQVPRTGSAYGGLFLYDRAGNVNHREYVQAHLDSAMKSNIQYCVSFYINLFECGRYGTDDVGIYFSPTQVYFNTSSPLPVIPQLNNSTGNFITDTAGWIKLEWIYTAIGGEQYFTIGNFKDDANTDTVVSNSVSTAIWAYAYIDDVSVIEILPVIADAGGDKTICSGDSTSIGPPNNERFQYSWSLSTGLSDSLIASPKASPTQTTTYILTVTDTIITCVNTPPSYDTVVVFVNPINETFGSAGINETTCKDSVQLGDLNNGFIYNWLPSTGLSNINISNPNALPLTSTNYQLIITDTLPCTIPYYDSVLITINCPDTIPVYNTHFPNIITPNGDGINDEWSLKEFPPGSEVIFYNRWGMEVERIFQPNSFIGRNKEGMLLPAGTYFYRAVIQGGASYNGVLQLVR